MSDTTPGLPLTSSRVEQVFPTLTPAQIRRIAAHGHTRAMHRGEVLVELKDRGDLLCRLLQGQQHIYAALLEDCWRRGLGKQTRSAGHEVSLLGAGN